MTNTQENADLRKRITDLLTTQTWRENIAKIPHPDLVDEFMLIVQEGQHQARIKLGYEIKKYTEKTATNYFEYQNQYDDFMFNLNRIITENTGGEES